MTAVQPISSHEREVVRPRLFQERRRSDTAVRWLSEVIEEDRLRLLVTEVPIPRRYTCPRSA